jgi:phage terminase large subunit-like protein
MVKTKAKTSTKEEKSKFEEFKLNGHELVKKIKELIKAGNIRRIIIKNEKGKVMMEIPVTVAVIGAVFAPILAAVGALAALLNKCSLVVEKK